MLNPDVKEGLDGLIETANEAGVEWAEDILGYAEEDIVTPAKADMKKDGITDTDEQDAVATVILVKALYLAYREALTDIEDLDVRAYLQATVEKAGHVPLGEQPGFQANAPVLPPRGVVAPLVPPPKPPGFTPPKLG